MLADLNKSLDEAHNMIQKALDREPDNGAFLDSLGWVYYRQDKLDLAERYLVRSLEKIKTDPVVHSHLGDVYFKQGKFEQAKEQWELALREWDRSPEADRDAAEIAKLKKKLADVNAELSSRAQKDGGNN
jgi:tetratricopeptide (TPR) repeat protein